MVRAMFVLLGLALPAFVWAEEPTEPPPAEEDDWWLMLDTLPPRQSYDVGVGVSFSDITYFRGTVPPWIGFNIQANAGAHIGEKRAHRVGAALLLGVEGPVPEFFTASIEPRAIWDEVRHRVLIGATISPAILVHSQMTLTGQESVFALAPSASVRVGYSQPWSRVARRMFVVLEPRVRWIANEPSLGASIVVGSGAGR